MLLCAVVCALWPADAAGGAELLQEPLRAVSGSIGLQLGGR